MSMHENSGLRFWRWQSSVVDDPTRTWFDRRNEPGWWIEVPWEIHAGPANSVRDDWTTTDGTLPADDVAGTLSVAPPVELRIPTQSREEQFVPESTAAELAITIDRWTVTSHGQETTIRRTDDRWVVETRTGGEFLRAPHVFEDPVSPQLRRYAAITMTPTELHQLADRMNEHLAKMPGALDLVRDLYEFDFGQPTPPEHEPVNAGPQPSEAFQRDGRGEFFDLTLRP